MFLSFFNIYSADYYVSSSGTDNGSCASEWSACQNIQYALDNKVTEYNPENNYPALSLRDLLDRMSRHELNHAQQIEEIIVKLRNKR